MGAEVGLFIRKLHETHGVTFHLGQTVSQVSGRTVIEIDGSLDARDCAVVYPKGGRTLATVIISRDLQSLQAEATMEAEIRSQKRDVA